MAGWVLLILGAAIGAAGALPPLLVGAPRAGGSVWSDLFGLYGVGAVIYAGAGIGLIVLGALRISPLSDTLWHAVRVSLALAGAAAVVVVATMAAVYWLPGVGGVEFSEPVRKAAQDGVVITCQNNGSETANIYFPWPDLPPDARPRSGSDYVVDVYARERGQSDFRLLPNTRSAWSVPGGTALESGPIHLEPGLSEEVTLDFR